MEGFLGAVYTLRAGETKMKYVAAFRWASGGAVKGVAGLRDCCLLVGGSGKKGIRFWLG